MSLARSLRGVDDDLSSASLQTRLPLDSSNSSSISSLSSTIFSPLSMKSPTLKYAGYLRKLTKLVGIESPSRFIRFCDLPTYDLIFV